MLGQTNLPKDPLVSDPAASPPQKPMSGAGPDPLASNPVQDSTNPGVTPSPPAGSGLPSTTPTNSSVPPMQPLPTTPTDPVKPMPSPSTPISSLGQASQPTADPKQPTTDPLSSKPAVLPVQPLPTTPAPTEPVSDTPGDTSDPDKPEEPKIDPIEKSTSEVKDLLTDVAKPISSPPVTSDDSIGKESKPENTNSLGAGLPPLPVKAEQETKVEDSTSVPSVEQPSAEGAALASSLSEPGILPTQPKSISPVEDTSATSVKSPTSLPTLSTNPTQPGDSLPNPNPVSSNPETGDPDQAKMHEPVIVLPEEYEMGQSVSVKVKVGVIPHPMVADHHIQSVELLANETSIGKSDLKPEISASAEADFQVALSAGLVLKAVATCNQHGEWSAQKTIEILPSKGN